ncbi:MAG: class I SAM-dependent methyltransferase [Planctomycetota bacterium]|nr:class I SAM-dependent methyltransferase [Planctomycetota bacterium]
MTSSMQLLRKAQRGVVGWPARRRMAREKRRADILRRFHRDPDAACKAYFLFNARGRDSRRNFDRAMIRRAVEFDYLSWPRKIAGDVRGLDVLDVGCGTGLHAVGFLVVGVRSYTGMDPILDLHDDRSKNLRKRTKESFGWTPAQVQQRLPRVELISGTFEQVAPDKTFDIAVLHNVSEHLINIEEVFQGVWQRLRPEGRILFNHHNYYCWNGHHQPPKFVAEIDPGDPQQRKFLDWNHLDLDPETEASLAGKLNRIRLDEIRALTEKYFEVESWEEIPSGPDRGAGRLTDEIRRRFPRYSEREFTVQNVLCRARRRATPRHEQTIIIETSSQWT